ncbi:hypothetical protein [Allonocardiopsis opalescens]|nr:hypothetical protein [Allonocardiopsis opalescens]
MWRMTNTVRVAAFALSGLFAAVIAGAWLVARPAEAIDGIGDAGAVAVSGAIRAVVHADGGTREELLLCEAGPMGAADAELCQDLARHEDPFAEVPADAVCLQRVYGTERADVSGVWQGRAVSTTVTRAGSCEEERWQRLSGLLERG